MSKNRSIEVSTFVSNEVIERKILMIHSRKVMLDTDLAELYRVPTKVMIQSIKRNPRRFPPDFMWQLTKNEAKRLRSQFVTSKGRGGRRYLPYVFTEQGVAMVRRGTDRRNSRDKPAGVQGNILQGDSTYPMPKGLRDKSLLR